MQVVPIPGPFSIGAALVRKTGRAGRPLETPSPERASTPRGDSVSANLAVKRRVVDAQLRGYQLFFLFDWSATAKASGGFPLSPPFMPANPSQSHTTNTQVPRFDENYPSICAQRFISDVGCARRRAAVLSTVRATLTQQKTALSGVRLALVGVWGSR